MTEYVTVWESGQPTTLRWAAPVVRCRDCKHFFADFTRHDHDFPHYCELHGSDWVWPDGFCAWGERLQDAVDGGRICAEEGGDE